MLTYVRFYDQNAPNSISTWLCPRCRWGSLQHSPDPLAVFKGPTSKRREGKEKGKGSRGRDGRRGEEICQAIVKLLPTCLCKYFSETVSST